jgi:hypothetical protein
MLMTVGVGGRNMPKTPGRNMPKTRLPAATPKWPDYAENEVAGLCRKVTRGPKLNGLTRWSVHRERPTTENRPTTPTKPTFATHARDQRTGLSGLSGESGSISDQGRAQAAADANVEVF